MSSTKLASQNQRGEASKTAPHPPLSPKYWRLVSSCDEACPGTRSSFSKITAAFDVLILISTFLNKTSLLVDLNSCS